MPSVTFKNLSYHNAEQFKEAFYEPQPDIGYVYLSRHISWPNDDNPNTPTDCNFCETNVWDNMFAAKRITGNDVELVIPRTEWTGNTKYRAFDDTVGVDVLLSSNTSQNLKPMYVITTERNVYKCLANNVGANSTIQPAGDYGTANGTISTADGYIWKYMFNVKPSNRFLTNDWVPAPTNTEQLDFTVNSTGVVAGELTRIIVTNSGSGYTTQTKTACTFSSGATTITLANTTNLVANMAITGTGITTGTYITNIDIVNVAISLSLVTAANGGGSNVANTLTFSTRAYVSGTGTAAAATVTISNNSVSRIDLTSFGRNYSKANVAIYGNGSGATARAVIGPRFGHAYEPAKELCANNVMVSCRIGELDSTEGGIISTDTSFRQYGLVRNPYKYGQSVAANTTTSNSVISQTTNITVVSGTNYTLDEFVYQGASPETASFSGYVHAYQGNVVRLTGVQGNPTIGTRLIGATSGITRTLVAKVNPEFEPYTGDMLYISNNTKTERTDGQAENIKFVVKF
jgi:hypothetical protein